MSPAPSPGQLFLAEGQTRLTAWFDKIKHCVEQLTDEQLWWRPAEDMNSIANIILHLCGNVEQWIINGVTQRPDTRNRPQEFAERGPMPKTELLKRLELTVAQVQEILKSTTDQQLTEPRRIQGFDETVLSAIFHSLAHFNGHTQEIIYATRLQLGDRYRFYWVPDTPEQGADLSR